MNSLAQTNDIFAVWIRFVQFVPRRIPRIIDRVIQKLRGPSVKDVIDFDALHGTDTSEVIKVYRLDSVSASYIHSHGYDACDIARLSRDLSVPPIDRAHYEFIDLGCGKGRALIFAAEQGFGRVTGVELSPMLVKIAAMNLKRCGVDGEILAQDASTFTIPDHPCVCYLYDPFGEQMMKRVAANVESRLKRSTEDLWIIYRGPLYSRILESCEGLEIFDDSTDTTFYRRSTVRTNSR